jgi:glycosyltransferase involved in cell wall biosynthesis
VLSLKKWQLLVTALSLGASAATIGADAYMRSEAFNYNDSIAEPPKTSIIIPTLNEEAYLLETLASLENQNVKNAYPEKFETIVVDSGSTDKTLEIAEKFDTKVLNAPRGKLTARHMGVMNAKGEIMVGVDADTYYPPNYLNLILRQFKNPEVVGVSTPRLCGRDGNTILNTVYIWKNIADGIMGARMPGSNSNFRKTAYLKIGGFNLAINQFNQNEVIQEEEYAFPERLRKIGKVVWLWKAPSYTSARRWTSPTPQKRSFGDQYILLYPEFIRNPLYHTAKDLEDIPILYP